MDDPRLKLNYWKRKITGHSRDAQVVEDLFTFMATRQALITLASESEMPEPTPIVPSIERSLINRVLGRLEVIRSHTDEKTMKALDHIILEVRIFLGELDQFEED